jgi:hypothetical protein
MFANLFPKTWKSSWKYSFAIFEGKTLCRFVTKNIKHDSGRKEVKAVELEFRNL